MKKELASILLISALVTAPTYAQQSDQTVGLFKDEQGAYEGYTLFTPRKYTTTYLVDMKGQLVNSWQAAERVEHAEFLDNGLLLRGVKTNLEKWEGLAGVHGLLEMVDWDNNVIWSFNYSNEDHILHHDFMMMPNGNLLLCSFDSISKEDVIAAGRDPETIEGDDMVVERILEVEPDYINGGGEIVWSWSTWDHLIQDFDNTKDNFGDVGAYPGRLDVNYYRSNMRDWNHVDAVDYNEDMDMIMVTIHINDEVVLIDHSTTTAQAASSQGGLYGKGGEILYRWGNPAVYRAGTRRDKHYNAVHNAHWIPKGLKDAGNVLVMSNNYSGENSTIELVELPFDANDTTIDMTEPVTISTVFDDFHSSNMGGSQRLPNDNTLITEAVKGRIIEITPNKEIVWEYVIPVASEGPLAQGETIPATNSGDLYNETFLSFRLGVDHPALMDKDLTPRGTIETYSHTISLEKGYNLLHFPIISDNSQPETMLGPILSSKT